MDHGTRSESILEMVVHRKLDRDREEHLLRYELSSSDNTLELNREEFGPVGLRPKHLRDISDHFTAIECSPSSKQSLKEVTEALEIFGLRLSMLLPEDLRQLLWSLRDRVKHLLIQSTDLWIPWELTLLTGRADNGEVAPSQFLSEAFALSQWVPKTKKHDRLPLNRIALVAPSPNSASLRSEVEYVLGLQTEERQVDRIGAERDLILSKMRSIQEEQTYDGWHFAGHGGLPGRGLEPEKAYIRLNDDNDLQPDHLLGIARDLGVPKPPLIFLNACRTGRGGSALSGSGGWAIRFINAGAGAFIGTYWNVEGRSSLRFAEAFYESLLAGTTIAEAVREARLKIKEAGDPTWLAYTLFADPIARGGGQTNASVNSVPVDQTRLNEISEVKEPTPATLHPSEAAQELGTNRPEDVTVENRRTESPSIDAPQSQEAESHRIDAPRWQPPTVIKKQSQPIGQGRLSSLAPVLAVFIIMLLYLYCVAP